VLLALGAVLASTMGSAASGPPRDTGTAANRLAAAGDTEQLLGRLALPEGSGVSSRELSGGGSTLAQPVLGLATPDVVDRHAWWVVPGSPQTVLAFIQAHPPAGSNLSSSGTGGSRGQTTSWFVRFQWPPVAGVLQERYLAIALVALPDGSTGVRDDAQDVWIVPRPGSERIPPAARVLDVTVGRPGRRPSLSMATGDRASVARIAAMIDRLPTVQPDAIVCPAYPVDGPYVTFTFRATRRGPTFARAREPAWVTEPTTACDPMELEISGRVSTALLGGAAVLQRAERLLGLSLRRAA
jgi:hypothetical protein